jgi:hypothetical protein
VRGRFTWDQDPGAGTVVSEDVCVSANFYPV